MIRVPTPPLDGSFQRIYYQSHHSDEWSGGGFIARGWERVGGGIYARRTWQITGPNAVETTIMNLKHTPE